MKFDATFAELANIYGLIAKAETKLQTLTEAETAYIEASEAYTASDYQLSKGMEMSACLDLRDKAEKAVLKVYGQLCDALGIDKAQKYGEEAFMASHSKRCTYTFLNIAKSQATRLANSAR